MKKLFFSISVCLSFLTGKAQTDQTMGGSIQPGAEAVDIQVAKAQQQPTAVKHKHKGKSATGSSTRIHADAQNRKVSSSKEITPAKKEN